MANETSWYAQRLRQRVDAFEKWLSEQPIDVKAEQAHIKDGTPERAYWHHGYMMALKDVLKLMGDGETRQ